MVLRQAQNSIGYLSPLIELRQISFRSWRAEGASPQTGYPVTQPEQVRPLLSLLEKEPPSRHYSWSTRLWSGVLNTRPGSATTSGFLAHTEVPQPQGNHLGSTRHWIDSVAYDQQDTQQASNKQTI
ncbi:hypothetical protein F2Q68_00002921 [Brassica cretica]|uniref:Uncharacterized protein n=1 Tax=Brassica cretica TaxID=69181 RepID=A0A8S9JE85_BRACR|nr:hypothetical protein F2Q68_00002921 [Brassica cretica]